MTVPITFLAPMLDTATGQVRDATIEISPGGLLVRLSAGRPRREDGPHHAVADFTEQATEIARALEVRLMLRPRCSPTVPARVGSRGGRRRR